MPTTPPFHVKQIAFELKDVSDTTGEFEGYGAVFNNLDRVGDIIMPGAFHKSLPDFLHDGIIANQHNWDEPIGKPLAAHEDEHGLYLKAMISDTSLGRDVRTLLRDRVVKKLSIGFDVADSEAHTPASLKEVLGDAAFANLTGRELDRALYMGRMLKEINPLYEVSPVSVPANNSANILMCKNASGSAGLALAAEDHPWNAAEAESRVRAWAKAADGANGEYGRAFFWRDADAASKHGAYKMLFCDVIGEDLVAVPAAIKAAAEELSGTDIPDVDREACQKRCAYYLKQIGAASPWNAGSDFSDGSLPAALKLDAHSGTALASVAECAAYFARLKFLTTMDSKSGRVLSEANRTRISSLVDAISGAKDAMDGVRQDLADLLDATKPSESGKGAPNPDEARRLFASFQYSLLNLQS